MGLMPAAGGSPFVKLDKQSVIGHLKATGSRDRDVLLAQKTQLIAPAKNLKYLGWICIGGGAFFTITIILAWFGIPIMLFGWWVGRYGKRNIQAVEDGYAEYVASVATRAVVFLIAASLAASTALAQSNALRTGVVYQCPSGPSFKVVSCAGTQDTASCDVQAFNGGQPGPHAQFPRHQVTTLAQSCHVQTASEATAAARGVAAPPADANGFKIGDTVDVNTGFGWMNAVILSMNGNNYRVRTQVGVEVTKTYPSEVRRIGAPTAKDRAAGIYNLHDRVQVNVQGRWETGEIMTTLGSDYQVRLSGNRTVWAAGTALRPAAAEAAPRAAPAGTPPRPGLSSCAGKIEGRYATTGGFGNMTIEFRSGKAIMKDTLGEVDMTLECWTAGDKVYLHKPGDPAAQDMPIDINDDGTLQTPMGELKKKGK